MSGLFKSTVIKGNRITDFTQTTATVGVVIPFGYGRFPVDGNVIFAPLPPKENRTVKRQGKGGVKQESFTYTLSYAIAFCRGPIYGYWWIKRNGKVVWTNDPNAPIEDAAYAAKWAQKATFYYGTSSQMPDSTIESYKGSGQVSAFRYLAYIVVEDDDVTEGGGAVPSYEAVPIASPPEIYLTSKPYAQIFYDRIQEWLAPVDGQLKTVLFESDMQPDNVSIGLAPIGGELRTPPPGELQDDNVNILLAPHSGRLKDVMNIIDAQDELVSIGLAPVGGKLKLNPRGDIQKDQVNIGLAPVGGSMFTAAYLGNSLFHFDGADGSTSFPDEYGKVWVPNGGLQISDDQTLFGGNSAFFNGTNAYLSPSLPDMSLEGSVFTVETWAWIPLPASWPAPPGNSQAHGACLIGQSNTNASGEQMISVNQLGQFGINLNRGQSGNSWYSAQNAFLYEQWVHLALVVDAAQIRGYVNGVNVLTQNTTRKWATTSAPLTIGYEIVAGYPQYKMFWNGYLKEFRLRREAVYNANFTPPSGPFIEP